MTLSVKDSIALAIFIAECFRIGLSIILKLFSLAFGSVDLCLGPRLAITGEGVRHFSSDHKIRGGSWRGDRDSRKAEEESSLQVEHHLENQVRCVLALQ